MGKGRVGILLRMQLVFRALRFEPRSVSHKSLLETTGALAGKRALNADYTD